MAITGKTQKKHQTLHRVRSAKEDYLLLPFLLRSVPEQKKSELNRALVFHMEYHGMGRYQMVDPSLPCLLFKKLPKRLWHTVLLDWGQVHIIGIGFVSIGFVGIASAKTQQVGSMKDVPRRCCLFSYVWNHPCSTISRKQKFPVSTSPFEKLAWRSRGPKGQKAWKQTTI